MKVLLYSFHLNVHILRFCPNTQKLIRSTLYSIKKQDHMKVKYCSIASIVMVTLRHSKAPKLYWPISGTIISNVCYVKKKVSKHETLLEVTFLIFVEEWFVFSKMTFWAETCLGLSRNAHLVQYNRHCHRKMLLDSFFI